MRPALSETLLASMAPPLSRSRRLAIPPVAVAVALLLLLVLPNPAGYVGGGGDDWYYVEAARCAAAHGWCLPETHWAARWPLVAPMGLSFALFGDGWWQAALVPLLYSLLAVAMFVRLVERRWGARAALIGGIAFVATASFAKGLLQPNVETVELALLLTAANVASSAWRRGDSRLWLAAGILLGFAAQARMTSLVWLPIGALALVLAPRARRRFALPVLGGFALPLAIEALVYGLWAGKPFLSQELSAAHTRIASSELPTSVDLTRSPLFNPQFIGGWHPAMDIHLHWTVDGIVNLLANPQMGPVLLAALAAIWLRHKALNWRHPAVLLAVVAALYTGALIYGLAIDPKARMFLPVAALAAAIVARLATDLWDAGERLLVGGLIAALVLVGAIETDKRFDMGRAGPLAADWARAQPGDVAVEDATRRFLTFNPTVRALPVEPAPARHLIVLVAGSCAEAAPVVEAPQDWVLSRAADFGRPNDPLNLCEFRRVR
ncbi:glycosyltransferase family 39 protein [Sphingomonas sp. SUN039]|uniref:glycosyltransferase family 39 protein n=1 Tax=Sphingomonas sp. SUN039 TaxID=2937787 RepID=UPI0021645C71|nr:glycosyltransferase family 39 protein [Sphingomonas sp. SUN039]UVO55126.1 glycosyltransferase family 39 protein [Sphingomonas sp. SUN039]